MKGDSLGATGLGLCPKLLKFSSCGPKIAVKDFVAELPTEFKRRLFICFMPAGFARCDSPRGRHSRAYP